MLNEVSLLLIFRKTTQPHESMHLPKSLWGHLAQVHTALKSLSINIQSIPKEKCAGSQLGDILATISEIGINGHEYLQQCAVTFCSLKPP
jgi:hypothetical protein